MKLLLLAALPLALVYSASADPIPRLVKDINTTPEMLGGAPQELTRVGDVVYFRGRDEGHGYELWKTDGTEAGTVMVKDIRPGQNQSYPRDLMPVGDRLLFTADGDDLRPANWISDGTEEGTVRLGGPAPSGAHITGGTLFYSASTGNVSHGMGFFAASGGSFPGGVELNKYLNGPSIYGRPFVPTDRGVSFDPGILVFPCGESLWQSDGTVAGTRKLAALPAEYPGTLQPLGIAGETLYLRRYGSNGQLVELWKYRKGSAQLDFVSGTSVGGPSVSSTAAVVLGGLLIFPGRDASGGTEPWVSDGTQAGTVKLADVYPGTVGSDPEDITLAGGVVYFTARNQANDRPLWRTDGTPAGTWEVGHFGTHELGGPRHLTTLGGVLYFGIPELGKGVSLWRCDGTAAGSTRLRIIKSIYSYSPRAFTELGGRLIFNGSGEGEAEELWTTDGTEAGTHVLKDMVAGTNHGFTAWEAKSWLAVGNTLYFMATDGLLGEELWKTDGTAGGTVAARDISPGELSSKPGNMTELGKSVYFTSTSELGLRDTLWRMNRLGGGLKKAYGPLLSDNYASIGSLVPLKKRLLFVANEDSEGRLWTSDGSTRGTREVRKPELSLAWEAPLVTMGRSVYFPARTPDDVMGLWKIDRNSTAIKRVKSFSEGEPTALTVEGKRLFFTQVDGSGETRLWKSNGTPGGTVAVSAPGIWSKNQQPIQNLFNHAGKVYFSADDGIHGRELWASDGTAAGTTMVKDINPGSASSSGGTIGLAAGAGNVIYFLADDGVHGPELWRSDGTEAGTRLVADIEPGSEGIEVWKAIAVGPRLYFHATTKQYGAELWTSDGSDEGTVLVADLIPGAGSSDAYPVAAVRDKLYFGATAPGTGRELWVIDDADETDQ